MQSNKFAICESLERAQHGTRAPRSGGLCSDGRGRRVNLSARPERWRRSLRAPAESFPPWFCCERAEGENAVLSYICGFPVQSKVGRIFLIIELTKELSLSDHCTDQVNHPDIRDQSNIAESLLIQKVQNWSGSRWWRRTISPFCWDYVETTTFDWNILWVCTTDMSLISISSAMRSTSSFRMATLANSFSRANFSAVFAICRAPANNGEKAM